MRLLDLLEVKKVDDLPGGGGLLQGVALVASRRKLVGKRMVHLVTTLVTATARLKNTIALVRQLMELFLRDRLAEAKVGVLGDGVVRTRVIGAVQVTNGLLPERVDKCATFFLS